MSSRRITQMMIGAALAALGALWPVVLAAQTSRPAAPRAAPVITAIEPRADGYVVRGRGFRAGKEPVQVFENERRLPPDALMSVSDQRIEVRSRVSGSIKVRVTVGTASSAAMVFTAPVAPAACNPATTCSGHGTCSATGTCVCNTGWTGAACNACSSGSYGPTCAPCPGGMGGAACSGHGTCADGVSGTGQCSCHSGYSGVACNACQTNHYGYPACRYCVASTTCRGNGSCDAVTGHCICQTGFTGSDCSVRQ